MRTRPTVVFPVEAADEGFLRSLTFELGGRQRWDARPGLAKMYRVPPDRAWWPAVGAPLERGVRHRWALARWDGQYEVPSVWAKRRFPSISTICKSTSGQTALSPGVRSPISRYTTSSLD